MNCYRWACLALAALALLGAAQLARFQVVASSSYGGFLDRWTGEFCDVPSPENRGSWPCRPIRK